MNECGNRENGAYCYFHPKEILVGVCHLCLNERLLILAAKQGLNPRSYNNNKTLSYTNYLYKSKPSISLIPNIFSIGSFLSRRDIRHHRRRKSDHHDDFVDFADDPDDTTSTSLEDESFISIKFGDNGVASWDKSISTTTDTVSKVSLEHCGMPWGGQTLVKHGTIKGNCDINTTKCVVEHAKPHTALRWRTRIRQLLHVSRWKSTRSSNKANAGGGNNNSKGEGVKVVRNNKGWIRNLRIKNN